METASLEGLTGIPKLIEMIRERSNEGLQEHCLDMPNTTKPTGPVQFSVTLPSEAVQLLMKLKGKSLYGTTRGEIARTIILARLEDLAGRNITN